MRTKPSRKACEENGKQHFDAKHRTEESSKDAKDEHDATDYFEPCDEGAKELWRHDTEVCHHSAHHTDIVNLHPPMSEEDVARADAEEQQPERLLIKETATLVD